MDLNINNRVAMPGGRGHCACRSKFMMALKYRPKPNLEKGINQSNELEAQNAINAVTADSSVGLRSQTVKENQSRLNRRACLFYREKFSKAPNFRPKSSRAIANIHRHCDGCFICLICKDDVRNGVITICGHMYCWACLWEYKCSQDGPIGCPRCKKPLRMHEDVIPYYGGRGAKSEDNERCRVPRPPGYYLTPATRDNWFLLDPPVEQDVEIVDRSHREGNANLYITQLYDLILGILIILVAVFYTQIHG